METMIFLRP